MPPAALWMLERKADVDLAALYGSGTFVLAARMEPVHDARGAWTCARSSCSRRSASPLPSRKVYPPVILL